MFSLLVLVPVVSTLMWCYKKTIFKIHMQWKMDTEILLLFTTILSFYTRHQESGCYDYITLTFTVANEESSTEFLEAKIAWPKDRKDRLLLYLFCHRFRDICLQQTDLFIKGTCLHFRIGPTIYSSHVV